MVYVLVTTVGSADRSRSTYFRTFSGTNIKSEPVGIVYSPVDGSDSLCFVRLLLDFYPD